MSVSTTITAPVIRPGKLSGAWMTVALLCVVGCLNYLDRSMISTMRESVVRAIPMTEAQFGLQTSVFLWVYAFLSPLAGFLADKFARSKVIIGSLFVWSLVTLLTAHVHTYQQLLISRALMGISEACYIPAALALIVDYHRGSTRSTATGIHLAGIMVGQSLGFTGGMIAEKYAWTTAFTVFGLIGILYAIVLIFFLRDAPKQENMQEQVAPRVSFSEAMKLIMSKKSFILTLSYFSLLSIVGWMIMGWLPTYYREHFNLSQSLSGLYATAYVYPAALVGMIVGGFLADRWSKTNPKARVLLPVVGLLIAAPFVFVASKTDLLPIAIFCFMIFIFTRSFSDANMMPVLCTFIDSRYIATAYGILNLFACVVGGIGIYAAGILRDSKVNLSIVFQSASIIMVISAVLLYLVKPAKDLTVQTKPE
jgi:MFS family permease